MKKLSSAIPLEYSNENNKNVSREGEGLPF
jgi:hypothetical protein